MVRKKRKMRALLSSVLAVSIAAVSLPGTLAAGEGEGLWAEYYSGSSFGSYIGGGVEGTVDHEWTESAPPQGLSNVENFSARWVGRILAEEGGAYTIYSNVDDGAQIYIDGKLAINDPGPHFPAENAASFNWRAGSYHTVRIEYYNGELGGTMQLKWTTPSGGKEIIPQRNLYLADRGEIDWVASEGRVAARAHIYWQDTADYRLVLESYDEAGRLVESKEAGRPQDRATVWTTESLPYADGLTYKANLLDAGGEKIADGIEKVYEVDAVLEVDASKVTGQISPYLYGAGIEDVNHELYGGIWSQMVFGESFAEPAAVKMDGFSSAGGQWTTETGADGGILSITRQDNGPKMVLDDTDCESGTFSADVYFEGGGPVGFIVKTREAKAGADSFYGYEVGLMNGAVRAARHENNFSDMREYPCADAAAGKWINLKVETTKDNIAIFVDDQKVGDYATAPSVTAGAMGFRAWDGAGKFRNIRFQRSGGQQTEIPVPTIRGSVSGMWDEVQRGTAQGQWLLDKTDPYTKSLLSTGAQSQRISFQSGEGAVGVSNMALNRKGMNFEKDKVYEGYVYARSKDGAETYLVLESADGTKQYAETRLDVEAGGGWKKYAFTLTPDTKDAAGRMTVELRGTGTVDLGYVYLQPGEWGRYKGLPIRRDVAEKLEEQNLSLLRFGGSMVNVPDYKWKHMLGEPEDRPSYSGCWYACSSFGFGVKEFLDLCEALGVLGIPTFNSYETEQDMVDFIDFATGTDGRNPWVKQRIAMGHPEPYDLPYLQIGNEERIDTVYADRFNRLAAAIWERDANITLVAADLVYYDVITDPGSFTGAASGITNLNGHKSIMEFAKARGRTVYFDVHTWTHGPGSSADYTKVLLSFYDALHQVCPGTDAKVVIFEFNALAHNLERALGNAYATIDMEKYSDKFPIVCSANCLQVDGHNDNGWDQGLVFMDNDSVWFQPPAYVTQMAHDTYQPNLIQADLDRTVPSLNYVAGRSDDGETLTLKFTNSGSEEIGLSVRLAGVSDELDRVTVTTLTAGNLSDKNTAGNPDSVKPSVKTLEKGVRDKKVLVTVAPRSYTVVTIEKGGQQALVPGDLDGDGEVTIQDVMEACKVLARQSAGKAPTGDEMTRGNLDGDGKFTIGDVMEICKILARKA